jgi:hypothetical protein
MVLDRLVLVLLARYTGADAPKNQLSDEENIQPANINTYPMLVKTGDYMLEASTASL